MHVYRPNKWLFNSDSRKNITLDIVQLEQITELNYLIDLRLTGLELGLSNFAPANETGL